MCDQIRTDAGDTGATRARRLTTVEIERVRRPFWTHQLIEYLVGIGLISAAVQMPQPAVPAILGLVIILTAAIAKGAAGAFRLAG